MMYRRENEFMRRDSCFREAIESGFFAMMTSFSGNVVLPFLLPDAQDWIDTESAKMSRCEDLKTSIECPFLVLKRR